MRPTEPATAEPPAARVGWRLGFALLALLLIAQAPLQVLVTDSGRDLATAFAIMHGDEWPLLGPELNGIWQLGPAWYFLLAAMLAFGGSVTGAGVLLTALATSKLWFAYRLASELAGRHVGLAAAALLAMPGWAAVGQIVLNHTALVEAACAATLWFAARAWRRGSTVDGCVAALLAALAIHAHPTAVIVLPWVAGALLRTTVRRRLWWLLPVAAVAFMLPFVPMLVAEAAAGWPQFHASREYASASSLWPRLAAVPELTWGLSFGQAEWVRHYLLADNVVGRWWQAGWLLGLLFVTIAAVRTLRHPGPLRWLLPYTLLAAIAIGLLRDSAPAWMFHPLAPLGATVGALALTSRLSPPRAAAMVAVLLLIAIGINTALLAARWQITQQGLAPRHSLTLGDIRTHQPLEPPSPWLPIAGHDALTRKLCGERPVALHGDLATLYHFGQGVSATLGCGDVNLIQLGGMQAIRHIVGVPRAIADALSLPVSDTLYGFALLSPIEVLHPQPPVLPRPHTRYLRNIYVARMQAGTREQASLEVDCSRGELLLLTNLVPLLNPASVRVERGDARLQPVARTLASDYFRCDGPTRVSIDAVDLSAWQVLRLAR